MIVQAFKLIFNPSNEWKNISEIPESKDTLYLGITILLATLPPIAIYYGITQIGWTVGSGQLIKITTGSALPIVSLFYCALITSMGLIGYLICWMAQTYDSSITLKRALLLVAFSATPLFFVGLLGFYPIFWLDLIIGVAAGSYCFVLLQKGIPIVARISDEQGFLFFGAISACILVIGICVMVATVLLWDMGFAPTFTD